MEGIFILEEGSRLYKGRVGCVYQIYDMLLKVLCPCSQFLSTNEVAVGTICYGSAALVKDQSSAFCLSVFVVRGGGVGSVGCLKRGR